MKKMILKMILARGNNSMGLEAMSGKKEYGTLDMYHFDVHKELSIGYQETF